MVADQLRGRDISDERVLTAMERVPRELFVDERDRKRAVAAATKDEGSGSAPGE